MLLKAGVWGGVSGLLARIPMSVLRELGTFGFMPTAHGIVARTIVSTGHDI
jgi:hypothetical protein